MTWWQRGSIYHIYPRSFMDGNGDGTGDLPGIISRLDYLEWLGVDAIWISPIFPSPMADFGYDVSDYTSIGPLFGTLDDFDRLLAEAHRRGLRVLLDYVPNHTSDRHPWFLESRSSCGNPRRRILHGGDDSTSSGPRDRPDHIALVSAEPQRCVLCDTSASLDAATLEQNGGRHPQPQPPAQATSCGASAKRGQ